MSVPLEQTSLQEELPPLGSAPSPPRPMSARSRVTLVIFLTVACLVTSYGSNHLLGAILNVPPFYGVPLVKTVAALVWLVPLLFLPSLRDIGSFRLPLTWTILLVLPVLAINWSFSNFFAHATWLPGLFCLHLIWKGMSAGVFEELMFRGYAFRRVPEAHPRLVVLATSFLFAIAHLPWITERPLAAVLPNIGFALVTGLALGIIRLISGSLAWCMILHGLINAAAPIVHPSLTTGTPYVLAVVAVASVLTLYRHPAFNRRSLAKPENTPARLADEPTQRSESQFVH